MQQALSYCYFCDFVSIQVPGIICSEKVGVELSLIVLLGEIPFHLSSRHISMKSSLTLSFLASCLITVNAQWFNFFPDIIYDDFYTLATNGDTVLVGSHNTIYISVNNGQSWAPMMGPGVNLPYLGDYMAILVYGSNIYAGSDEGVYLSQNGGATFELKNSGMGYLQVYDVFKVGSTIYAGVHCISGITHYDQRILRTTDNCETWVDISGDLPFSVLTVFSIAWDGTWLYAGTNKGVYASQNQGQNWIALNNGLPEGNVYKLLIVNRSFAFAGNGYGLYRRINNAGSWTKLTNGLPDNKVITAIKLVGNHLIVSVFGGSVYVSPDMGDSWIDIGEGIGTNALLSLTVNEDYVFVLTEPSTFFQTPAKVFRRPLEEVLNINEPDLSLTDFRFRENPVNNFLSIENQTGAEAIAYFYSTDGHVMLQTSLAPGMNVIDIRNLPTGILLTRCVGTKSLTTGKILKL